MRVTDSKAHIVGECPLWDEKRRLLYTIDIRGKFVRCLDWASGEITQRDYGQELGCLALTDDGSLLMAMTDGIYIDSGSGKAELFSRPERMLGRRFNDGKAGPDGRFYVGTTDYSGAGAFYRLDKTGRTELLFDRVACSNGLAWSRDGKTMYYCDSLAKKLEAFDFDMAGGTLSNRRTLLPFPLESGEFDGMCMDAEGQLWTAVWGAHCVLRIDPLKLRVTDRLDFPVKRMSCTCFAGDELDTLVVTSAAYQSENDAEPLAGCTFAVRPGVTGLPSYRFAL